MKRKEPTKKPRTLPPPTVLQGDAHIFTRGQQVPEMVEFLRANGFVVIEDAIDGKQCADLTTMAFRDMAKAGTGFKHDDLTTHSRKCLPGTMILSDPDLSFGHAECMWVARDLVRPVFAQVYDNASENNMVASFDVASFFPNWNNPIVKKNGSQTKTDGNWLHSDQPPSVNEFEGYQGVLLLTTASAKTGGFVCVPKLHLEHKELYPDYTRMNAPFARYDLENDSVYSKLTGKVVLVTTRTPGSLIIWDSRLPHCSHPALEKPDPNTEYLRLALFTNLCPRNYPVTKINGLATKEARDYMVATSSSCNHQPWILKDGRGLQAKKKPRYPRSIYAWNEVVDSCAMDPEEVMARFGHMV